MDKRKKVLLSIGLLIIGYVALVLLIQSPMGITKEKVVEKNFQMIDQSQSLRVKGQLHLNLVGENSARLPMSYIIDLKHNLDQKDLRLDFYPALESLETEASFIMDANHLKVFYSILDQKDVLGYEQPLEKEAIHSKAFLKEMIQQVVKDASQSEASYSKDVIEVIEKGKQVKKYGYLIEKSLDKEMLKENINELLQKEPFNDMDQLNIKEYQNVIDSIDLKTKVLLNEALQLRKIEFEGFYEDSRILELSLMVDFKEEGLNIEKK